MRSGLQALVVVTAVVAGGSGILGTFAYGDEPHFYSSGAPASDQSNRQGGYNGYAVRQFGLTYQVPASTAGATTYYWYYYAQPVYQVPASTPGGITGYWYFYPQPVYQVPASSSAGTTSSGYYYSIPR
jgi:hypothetical protein